MRLLGIPLLLTIKHDIFKMVPAGVAVYLCASQQAFNGLHCQGAQFRFPASSSNSLCGIYKKCARSTQQCFKHESSSLGLDAMLELSGLLPLLTGIAAYVALHYKRSRAKQESHWDFPCPFQEELIPCPAFIFDLQPTVPRLEGHV